MPRPAAPRRLASLRSLHAAGLLIALGASPLIGCGDVEDLDNFDVPITAETTIQGRSLVGDVLSDFPTLEPFTRFDLSQAATFQNKDHDPEDVDSVVLERLTLTTIEPAEQDLSFFGEVIFYVEAEGLERKEIARQSSFPPGQTQVSFETSPDDIKAYVLANEATVSAEINDTTSPPQDTRVEVEAVFDVDVNVL